MPTALPLLSALAGFMAVALGAFGAHALGDDFSVKAQGWWDTATLYLIVHAVAGLAIGLSQRGGLMTLGGSFLVFGAALFAATLYIMALGGPTWLGAVTPLGGLGMLAGWAIAALAIWRG